MKKKKKKKTSTKEIANILGDAMCAEIAEKQQTTNDIINNIIK